MSRERQQRIFELLDEALERSPEDRTAFLDEACGDDDALRQEVETLLDTDVGTGLLAEPVFNVHAEDAGLGRHIDHYKLVQLLDRGGMGTVYLAEREDFEKRVALKLIRRGLDVDDVFVRRFQNERQILARLEHPHIAQLLDGGTTDDRLPYFVMEYVEGEPIDRYCKARRPSVDERLELFGKVCSAVQFAHRNLVIHRDLKPGNILITADGEPKLLDFGVAKLLDDGLAAENVDTKSGQGPMTPRYASPEQLRGEPVTTASDVYSLGVLLYELLTGLDPYDVETGRSAELAQAICEREPDRPSTAVRRRGEPGRGKDSRQLRHRLTGDLDSIVLKAMRKEPLERYSSVEQISEDIQRHLTGQPVAARAGTFVYRTGKFVRRHWLAMTAAAVFLLLMSFATVSWRQSVHDRESAERESRRSQIAFQFLVDLFKAMEPDKTQGEELTALELLERARGSVLEDLKDVPELQVDVAGTLGNVFHSLDAFDESKQLMEMSLEIARDHYGEDHTEIAKRMGNLGVLLLGRDPAKAKELFHRALEMRQRLKQESSDLFRVKSNLATAHMALGEFEHSEELYLDVLDTRLELYGEIDRDVATSRRNLGVMYYAQGDFEQAEEQLKEALRIRRHEFGDEHTLVASVLDWLGNVVAARDRLKEARQLYNEALAIRRQRLGDDHQDVATTKKNLAALLASREPETAHLLVTEALTIFHKTQPGGWKAADAEGVLGAVLVGLGRYEEAEPLVVDSYTELTEIRGERDFRTRGALERILELYTAWDKPAELERYQEK